MNILFAAFVAAGVAASPVPADNVAKTQSQDAAPVVPTAVPEAKPVDMTRPADERDAAQSGTMPIADKPVAVEGSADAVAATKAAAVPEAPRR